MRRAYRSFAAGLIGVVGLFSAHSSRAADVGPYNATFLAGGVGLSRPLGPDEGIVAAGAPWSMTGWIRWTGAQTGPIVIARLGAGGQSQRDLLLTEGRLSLSAVPGAALASRAALRPGEWYAIAATYDGQYMRLYLGGEEVAARRTATQRTDPVLALAPLAVDPAAHFGGSLAFFTLTPVAKSPDEIHALAQARPNFALVAFDQVGVGWPLQEHAWRGLLAPQPAWTLPHGTALPRTPVADVAPRAGTGSLAPGLAPSGPAPSALRAVAEATWSIEGWHLAAAPTIDASGSELSRAQYPDRDWLAAIVPGTVLTTMIARGIYPDPDFGLDNLAIPEILSRQAYWYRCAFFAPETLRDRDLTLIFKGINYSAEVWLNGTRLGTIRGAFIRGNFDVSGILQPGQLNTLAVRIAPPPHPGIPHEQSIAAGPGNNGGAMAIDGPTFIASEGWDWIPGIRDRNTGIWQDVQIKATDALRVLDPHVVTHLPLPRTDTAEITVTVPVDNRRKSAVTGAVELRLEGIQIRKAATFKPGVTEVVLDAREFPELRIAAPRLWWPNGYGPANLYSLEIRVSSGASVSDSTAVRFGIRELTYELSLFDHEGRLRRVEMDPTLASLRGEGVIDVRHEAIKRTPQGWAESLTGAGERSPAIRASGGESLTPYLVIRVNGVAIAARGGSWGMDDSRKRVSRDRLEPYFRLHRDAHLNIIRNWLGQNTEDVFFDLADEYGLLVLNDFWISTQDFQLEPEDPALFLANARDVISRYRNHPSIAVWFGRNEGVPQPILNEGLADLVADLDGTRYYTGSSNAINLQGSGPYDYRAPEHYFTDLARGFSVEVGTPSLSTLESLRASIPASDLWPLNDTYAYHDWHSGGNGDVATFMATLAEQYGTGTSLEDFERKAQLMNYVSYRAIFEGFQAHLWSRNSGRLLWMSHPSWPSNTWQIYSSDYDTGAAYYAVKKACEPVHAQLDLPDLGMTVVNTTRTDRRGLELHTQVFSLDDRLLAQRRDRLDAPANDVRSVAPVAALASALRRERLVLMRLTLTDRSGELLSENTYWQAETHADERRLNDLPPQPIELSAADRPTDDGTAVTVRLANRGKYAVLNAKITALDSKGARVLPVYYSDNYLALLPGEDKQVQIQCPAQGAHCARIALRGWNVAPQQVSIGGVRAFSER